MPAICSDLQSYAGRIWWEAGDQWVKSTSRRVPVQPPSAASGRRRLLAGQAQPIYDVGGAEHVAVNCTIYAAYRDLLTAQTTLSDSVKSGGFVQVLNQTGEGFRGASIIRCGVRLQGVQCKARRSKNVSPVLGTTRCSNGLCMCARCRARHREGGDRAVPDDPRPGGACACARARARSARARDCPRCRACHQHSWAAAPAGGYQQRSCPAACSPSRLWPGVAHDKGRSVCRRRGLCRQAAF